MSGDGIARLIDVSRLMSRAGRGLTGIDRVERAYVEALLDNALTVWGLARTSLGYLLLDEDGLRGLLARLDGNVPWGEASRFSRIFNKLEPMQQRALSDMRKLAVGRSTKRQLGRMLQRYLPDETTYLNIGHNNLTDYVIHGVKSLKRARIAVFLHDTIPLDQPELQRDETAEQFKLFLERVSNHTDLVIYNSAATEAQAKAHLQERGRVPHGLVAHLGVTLAEPDADALPEGLPPNAPYFVIVSTLEARKGHGFLLQLWEQMEKQTPPQQMPHLVMVGARGWKNDEFFYRFDHSQLNGSYLHEAGGLSDGAVAALMADAAGALFPSQAEGYGLPVFEALGYGVPVICSQLPVFREVAKDIPIYASVNDRYLWIRRIMSLTEESEAEKPQFKPPSWDAHFNLVLRHV